MANTTFSGPVRSENGFSTISKNATTGTITTTTVMGSGEKLANHTPGAGITAGTGTVVNASVSNFGDLVVTQIYIDLTGLSSVATQGDIIGDDAGGAAFVGRVKAQINGTIHSGKVECLEAPTGGDPDIDIYAATEATGAYDGAIADLTETQLVDTGDHTLGSVDILTAFPATNQYLYLVANAATPTAAAYTAGKLLITLYGTAS